MSLSDKLGSTRKGRKKNKEKKKKKKMVNAERY